MIERLGYHINKPSAYRCFVFHAENWKIKKDVSKQISQDLGGIYIDILDEKIRQLDPQLGIYSPNDLKRDIGKWAHNDDRIVVVDEVDPIFDTWTEKQQQDFFRMITTYRTNSVILISTLISLSYDELIGENRISIGGGLDDQDL